MSNDKIRLDILEIEDQHSSFNSLRAAACCAVRSGGAAANKEENKIQDTRTNNYFVLKLAEKSSHTALSAIYWVRHAKCPISRFPLKIFHFIFTFGLAAALMYQSRILASYMSGSSS